MNNDVIIYLFIFFFCFADEKNLLGFFFFKIRARLKNTNQLISYADIVTQLENIERSTLTASLTFKKLFKVISVTTILKTTH